MFGREDGGTILIRKLDNYFQSHGVTTRKTLIFKSITDKTIVKLNITTQATCV